MIRLIRSAFRSNEFLARAFSWWMRNAASSLCNYVENDSVTHLSYFIVSGFCECMGKPAACWIAEMHLIIGSNAMRTKKAVVKHDAIDNRLISIKRNNNWNYAKPYFFAAALIFIFADVSLKDALNCVKFVDAAVDGNEISADNWAIATNWGWNLSVSLSLSGRIEKCLSAISSLDLFHIMYIQQ